MASEHEKVPKPLECFRRSNPMNLQMAYRMVLWTIHWSKIHKFLRRWGGRPTRRVRQLPCAAWGSVPAPTPGRRIGMAAQTAGTLRGVAG